MKKRRSIFDFMPIICFIMLIFSLLTLFSQTKNMVGLKYSDIISLLEEEEISEFQVKDDIIYMTLRNPIEGKTEVTAYLSDVESFRQETSELLEAQRKAGVLRYDFQPKSHESVISKAMPYLLAGGILLTVWFLMATQFGNSNGGNPNGNFTKANVLYDTGSEQKVTFADVAGVDEEKAELQEIVDFLKDPQRFAEMGVRIPKGFLLSGPPGTGKTLLARAVAGEADAQFLSISGSDFVELYVGVGASRVRDLFSQAKKVAPAIIFIDEIDAVGRRRGSGIGGGHDEREQTLNQLLVEMDGFQKNENVIVIAATNRVDILDPALLRPGRFDRKITIGRPVASGREAILKIHARGKRLAEDVNLHTVAMSTAGFTGADLSNLMNEAGILAVRDESPVIRMEHLEEAILKAIAGPEKKSWRMPEYERHSTAVHEAGHAVAHYRTPTSDPVHQITIVPRGNALGMTISLPDEDTFGSTRKQMFERIVTFLGGRVAEELFLEDISTGASNDLERATAIARDMVGKYGMTDAIGPVSYNNGDELFIGRDYEKTKSYSEKVAGEMDVAVRAIMDQAYARCRQILKDDEEKLMQVVAFLEEHETMSGRQFAACMEGKPIEEDDGSFFTQGE